MAETVKKTTKKSTTAAKTVVKPAVKKPTDKASATRTAAKAPASKRVTSKLPTDTPAKKASPAKPAVAAKKPAPAKKPSAKKAAITPGTIAVESPKVMIVTDEQRYRMVAEAAYYRAESNSFRSDSVRDWIEAEKDIAALLSGGSR